MDADLDGTAGSRIAKARALRGISRAELALALGVTPQAIEAVETGRTKQPSLKNAVRAASALGVSVAYLAGLSDDMEATPERAISLLRPPDPDALAAIEGLTKALTSTLDALASAESLPGPARDQLRQIRVRLHSSERA